MQTAKDITKQCIVLLPKYDYCDSDTETHKAAVLSLPFSVSLEVMIKWDTPGSKIK